MITAYIPKADLLCPHFSAPYFSRHKHVKMPKAMELVILTG